MDFIRDKRGATEAVRHGVRGPIYSDLRFKEQQVDEVWPAINARLRFRWPVYRPPATLLARP
jgi:hypothetical protein